MHVKTQLVDLPAGGDKLLERPIEKGRIVVLDEESTSGKFIRLQAQQPRVFLEKRRMRHAPTSRALFRKRIGKSQPHCRQAPLVKQLINLISPRPHKIHIFETALERFVCTLLQSIRFHINRHKHHLGMARGEFNREQSGASADFDDVDGRRFSGRRGRPPLFKFEAVSGICKFRKFVPFALSGDDELIWIDNGHIPIIPRVCYTRKMDTLIENLLRSTTADEWLREHGLGWIVGPAAINFVTIVMGAVLTYFAGRLFISYGVRSIIRNTAKHRAWHRKDVEKRETTLISMMHSSWKIIILIYVAAMLANRLFGFDLSPLFASAGIIGVALGFGSQSLVKDFLSGMFIIAENQYRVGDIVDIMGASGRVERVGTRSTVIRDEDGNVHYIPNGTINRVVNKTMGFSVARFSVEVEPGTSLTKIINLINKTGETMAQEETWSRKIINPPHFVEVGEITEKTMEIIVSGKTMPSDQWAIVQDMRRRLLKACDKAGITIVNLPSPSSK